MREFEFYLNENKVKSCQKDYMLAKSLVYDAKSRFELVSKLDKSIYSKILFENVYDALRDILDAILCVKGFKSYSHEASIAYLNNLNFEDSVLQKLDNFRYKRNSSKYYGKDVSREDVEEIISFYVSYSERLINVVLEVLEDE